MIPPPPPHNVERFECLEKALYKCNELLIIIIIIIFSEIIQENTKKKIK